MGILNNIFASKATLIFLYIGINIPYTTIFLLTFFANLSRTYEEAAAIDGCPPTKTFWKIMFPMAQSGLVTVTIFNWSGLFAAVVIVFLPTFILYLFLSEKIIGGVTGGIKG